MKKRCVFLITLLLLLSGCGACETEEGTTDSSVSAEETVAVAVWESTGNKMQTASLLRDDALYYIVYEREEDGGTLRTSIFRESVADGEKEEKLCLSDAEIFWYEADREGYLYLFYQMGEGVEYLLRKQTDQGEVLYERAIAETDDMGTGLGTIAHGAVSDEGEVCLASETGELYFFSSQGELTAVSKSDWDKETYRGSSCGLVNSGEQGIYTYQVVEETKLSLREVDFSQGALKNATVVPIGEKETLNIGSYFIDNTMPSSLEIFSGYEMGVLISDSDGLWSCRPEDGSAELLFSWGDSGINLKDYMIDAVGVASDGAIFVLARRSYEDVAYVRVDFRSADEVTEKKTVTLGGIGAYEIQWDQVLEMVSSFNRASELYQIEVVSYDSIEAFYMELLKGEGPDIIHMGALDAAVLADKGVLEALTDYFERSSVVREEDLLPSIRRAGNIQGELAVIIPQFQVCGLLVQKGTATADGWTVDEFLALAEENPDSLLLDQNAGVYRNTILNTAIEAELENYIDWQNGCQFESGEFVALLERIDNLPMPPRESPDFLAADYFEMDWRRFTDREYLVKECYVGSLILQPDIIYNGGFAEGTYADMVGYPNQNAEAVYKLYTSHPFGINSASGQKEGAWNFLEYLLSARYQDDMTTFPVRIDSFHAYMEKDEIGMSDIDLTEKDRSFIRQMVDNAYWDGNISCVDIRKIISEETAFLWAGDYSAETAAHNIQNRVSLYLSE